MTLIHIEDLSKHFKILNRREGLGGAFRDLLSGDCIPGPNWDYRRSFLRNILGNRFISSAWACMEVT